MVQFPKDFYWGAATSSYQVEGNNANADWWPWEVQAGKEKSALACRHFELYEHDFDLVKSLNHSAHRLSIEWSRIEPREGETFPRGAAALHQRDHDPARAGHRADGDPASFYQSGMVCGFRRLDQAG